MPVVLLPRVPQEQQRHRENNQKYRSLRLHVALCLNSQLKGPAPDRSRLHTRDDNGSGDEHSMPTRAAGRAD